MISESFVRDIPKIELHVHLEGSIRPDTVLKLAKRNGVKLPADTVEGLAEWYHFRSFPHFVDVYVAVSQCIKTPDDIETITKEFLDGQKAQNVLHSEITYTASTIEKHNGIPWSDQLAAIQSAREYGETVLGITSDFIIDIVRGDPPERALEVARWAAAAHGKGVCALGLAGEERLGQEGYEPAFALAREAGLPIIPHAGETVGPESIWQVLNTTDPVRIGHGVRCLEDPKLVSVLRDRQIPLEVCPSSNVCLGVYPSLSEHPLPELLKEGLFVTVNSDDPPMFGTTISDEYLRVANEFGWDEEMLRMLAANAARAALVSDERKAAFLAQVGA